VVGRRTITRTAPERLSDRCRHVVEHDGTRYGEGGPTDWWQRTEVEIEEFSGLTVAHLSEADDAWISGWVEVPR